MTFVRNHAKAIIACDFFIVVTATVRLVYVFVIMEVGRHLWFLKIPSRLKSLNFAVLRA